MILNKKINALGTDCSDKLKEKFEHNKYDWRNQICIERATKNYNCIPSELDADIESYIKDLTNFLNENY